MHLARTAFRTIYRLLLILSVGLTIAPVALPALAA